MRLQRIHWRYKDFPYKLFALSFELRILPPFAKRKSLVKCNHTNKNQVEFELNFLILKTPTLNLRVNEIQLIHVQAQTKAHA